MVQYLVVAEGTLHLENNVILPRSNAFIVPLEATVMAIELRLLGRLVLMGNREVDRDVNRPRCRWADNADLLEQLLTKWTESLDWELLNAGQNLPMTYMGDVFVVAGDIALMLV